MRNKIRKRLNKFFGKNFWDNLTDEQKQGYVQSGAHAIWKLNRNVIASGRTNKSPFSIARDEISRLSAEVIKQETSDVAKT